MTAINHALSGAVIGFIIGSPLLAIPVAFASHFLLDIMPHYGSRLPDDIYIRSKGFKRLLKIDISLCILLVGLLALAHPHHWLLAAVCAFFAALPDAEHLPNFIRSAGNKKYSLKTSWTTKIQWFERPPGAIVEIAWAIAAGVMLKSYL